MAGRFGRVALVECLRAEIRAGRPIYDALCGSGITAKMAARGGADMVTTHCLAYFRMQGLSSMAGYLPVCDANALTLELGERALVNVVKECALVAGLLCVDPTRDMSRFLSRIAAAGFHGVMNCPTVALIDGKFRNEGPYEHNLAVDVGRTVLLEAGNVRVIVTEGCQTPNDPAYFRLHGIDPKSVPLLCVKAKNHFRAAFELARSLTA